MEGTGMVRICDCFPELKALTAARERRYRADPDAPAPEGPQSFVEVKVVSIGQLNELVECKKSGHKFIISEPVHVGGQNVAPTPLEFLLSGAVGCYAAVFAFYAATNGVSYDSFEAVARAEFDVRGHMIADAPPSGFRKVVMEITVASDAPREELEAIERLALQGCPGISTLQRPVPVESRMNVRRPSKPAG
jgi:putative redox protein